MKHRPNDERIGLRGQAFDYAMVFLVIIYIVGFFML